MGVTLRIENETSLPDGGPVSITITGRRNIDIGRDSHLDWTLPDASRHISSKHCEIRYKDGGYWLHDVSTNGTFLYGNNHRMQAPHRLRNGDRFVVGHYIIAATVDAEEQLMAVPGPLRQPAPNYQELWVSDDVAPPIDRASLRPSRDRPTNPDFLDWAADVPGVGAGIDPFADPQSTLPSMPPASPLPPMGAPGEADSWAAGTRPAPSPPAEPPPVPTPRRPVYVASEPGGPWSGGTSSAEAPSAGEPGPEPRTAAGRTADFGSATTASSDLMQRLAQGARVPPDYFAQRDPAELAELMGQLIRLVIEGTMQLLNARQQTKRLARTSSHTVIEAFNNNPLKFSPTAEDALRILFGPATRSYLDAYSALAQGFDDLKTHQVRTYAAMQHALMAFLQDLDPSTIERESEDGGIAALVGSRKARLWDAYVARWQARAGRDGNGVIEAFMRDFAKSYDESEA